MKRDLAALASREYDLVIVGAGIYGVCAAWDAALRGLSAAIVDRGDFCAATSASSLKIVHGGFRYLQHADVRRMRDSIRERNVLFRIAPHLVYPLPFVIPTYGHGMQGKEILALALMAYNLISLDRNHGVTDPGQRIPAGHLLSREECLSLFPDLERRGLTGGVVFYDGQMYSPARLGFSYLKSAVRGGAQAANYVEATGLLRRGNRVTGVTARDLLSGEELEIRGKVVLNTLGPWADHFLQSLGIRLRFPLRLTKDLYLVVDRALSQRHALAVPGHERDDAAILSRGTRHFFIIPWRHRALIGSSHVLHEGPPDAYVVSPEDVKQLIDDVNGAYPPLGLSEKDVTLWNSGLVSFGPYYGRQSRIIDHARDHGLDGLLSVVGVRYTTSRGIAARAVDLVFAKLGRAAPGSRTHDTPIAGGDIEGFDALVRRAASDLPPGLASRAMPGLLRHHGSEYRDVLTHLDRDPDLGAALGDSTVIKAQVVHAVREEMAQTLADVVFRRTDLGTAGHPGMPALHACASLMARELGWEGARVQQELDAVRKVFP